MRSHLGEGGGGGGSVVVVLGEGLGAGEHEGAVLGLLGVVVVALVVGGVDVDAGAALHGREEGRRHAGPDPDRVPLQLLVRQDAAAAAADAIHG
jgi:L-aminopeptidase/D-esterase-like protein